MITGTNFLNCTTGLPQLKRFGLCAQGSNVLVAYNPQSSGLGLYTSCGDTSLKVNGVYYSLVNPPVTVSSASMSTPFFANRRKLKAKGSQDHVHAEGLRMSS